MIRLCRRRRLVRALCVVSLACVSLAVYCPQAVVVKAPAFGAALVRMPLDLEIRMDAGYEPGSFVATLNGVDVTSAFALDPPSEGWIFARAPGFWDDALLLTGRNYLVAEVTLAGAPARWVGAFDLEGDPFADAVDDFTPGSGAGFGQTGLPDVVLGAPFGGGAFGGSLDVLSLGQGGSLTLEFVDNVVVDGPGSDLTVFENAFLTILVGFSADPFAEPGLVSVSQDGVTWHVFDACETVPLAPPLYPGCAGVYPVFADDGDPAAPHASIPTSVPIEDLIGVPLGEFAEPEGAGGDRFDLADVGLAWARFVRIEDVGPALGQSGTIGLDVDAVAAIHAVPGADDDQNGVPDALE